MRFFSRKPDAAEDVPFDSVQRTPRNVRKSSLGGSTAFDAAPALDPADAQRTRARRRLIGAIALGLAAVVFVPMLFDRTAVAPNDDIGLQIPDRSTPFEGRRGVPDAAKGLLKPSSETPTVSAIAPPPDTPAPVAPPPDIAPPADKRPDPVEPAPVPIVKPADRPATPKPSVATTTADDPRAVAALEGKSAATVDNGARTYAVQIAAFSAADKARGLRDQLVANGLKSYTEPVATPQGPRIRVRLGPFASRDAADQAKQKLKTMKLDGSVVPL